MALVKLRIGTWALMFSSFFVFLSGCATAPIIEPTFEELKAASAHKKNIAILEMNDDGSPIQGIEALAMAELENLLVGHFVVVEREKVKRVISERDFVDSGNMERIHELGKLLGADYLVFGNVTASVRESQLKHRRTKPGKDEFSGWIWEEATSDVDVSVKIVDVSSAVVLYSDKKVGSYRQKSRQERFNDESLFKKTLRAKLISHAVVQIAKSFNRLDKEYSFLASRALEKAVKSFNHDLRTKFPHSGEILQIFSEHEVIVNLGSAYGVKPRDKLIIWEEKGSFKDPKTGIITILKEKKAILKVTKVTSGLTCIAKGSKKTILRLRVGDKIFTY
ncbi:MAG: hypothetical protein NG712_00040 [Omnitrophica bacterium]|nr:hypothetical protein [Candidatus Omnitrophota bacterium]